MRTPERPGHLGRGDDAVMQQQQVRGFGLPAVQGPEGNRATAASPSARRSDAAIQRMPACVSRRRHARPRRISGSAASDICRIARSGANPSDRSITPAIRPPASSTWVAYSSSRGPWPASQVRGVRQQAAGLQGDLRRTDRHHPRQRPPRDRHRPLGRAGCQQHGRASAECAEPFCDQNTCPSGSIAQTVAFQCAWAGQARNCRISASAAASSASLAPRASSACQIRPPGAAFSSSSMTERPARVASTAAPSPAGPPPTISRSGLTR